MDSAEYLKHYPATTWIVVAQIYVGIAHNYSDYGEIEISDKPLNTQNITKI